MKQTASRISVLVAVVLTVFAFIGLMPTWAQTPRATFMVNSQVDDVDANPGDGVCATESGMCTLRAAIQETNALPGADTIEVPAGIYLLTIPGKFENESATGDLDVTDDLTIMGAGMDETIIDGNHLDRVFDLRCPGGDPYPMAGAEMGDCSGRSQGELQVVISGVTVQHGDTGSGESVGGGIDTETTDLTIVDSRINDNQADSGGGIYQKGGTVIIINSELINNDGASDGGGIYVSPEFDSILQVVDSRIIDNKAQGGGGIYNAGTLTVSHTIFSNNWTNDKGGGIYNASASTAIINHSTFIHNTAFYGGGVYATANTGTVTINYSTLSQNDGNNRGGGIHAGGVTIVNYSTLLNNSSNSGGGIHVPANSVATINNSTLYQNSANYGAGIDSYLGIVTVNHSTLYDNVATDFGGGIRDAGLSSTIINNSTISNNAASSGGGIYYANEMFISNSIIAENVNGDCAGNSEILSLGYNLDSDGSCQLGAIGDLPHTDPILASLQDNGGATFTQALLPNSPAIDAGSCPETPTDQRGFIRPIDIPNIPDAGDGCDIGAYEVQPTDLTLIKIVKPNGADPGQGVTYAITIYNSGFLTANQAVISDTLAGNVTFAGPVTLDPPQPEAVLAQNASDLPTLAGNVIVTGQTAITLTLPVTINPDVPLHSKIINTAAITSVETINPRSSTVIFPVCLRTVSVLNTFDGGPGSLRQAVKDVCDGGTIDFDLATPATITLTNGELEITKTVSILGPGVDELVINGNETTTIFNVSGELHLEGLTIRDGGGVIGGGIYNTGILTINNSTLSSHSVSSNGGSIYNTSLGTVVINNSTLSDNSAVNGSSIYNTSSGAVVINNSTLSDNSASDYGAGIYNTSSGTVIINNSTLSGNSADHGSGIYNISSGPVTISHSTFSNNSSTSGGGIYATGMVTINNSIIASNGGSDCAGSPDAFISLGYNLDSDGSCYLDATGDQSNTDPLLGPLQDNDGVAATFTHALLVGSPATDAGSCPGVTTDQRGFTRPIDNPGLSNTDDGCDIGAYEVQPVDISLITTAETPFVVPGQTISYTITIYNSGFLTATQATVSDSLPGRVTFAGPVTLSPPQPEAVLAEDASDLPALARSLIITGQTAITLTLPVTVNLDAPFHKPIRNTVAITSSETVGPRDSTVAMIVCRPTVTVTTVADSGPGSLRQAIADGCDDSEINFSLSTPATIVLTSGHLVITKTLTIHGPGADNLAISGNNATNIFNVSGNLDIIGLTIQDGNAATGSGGGIFNTGVLTISNSTLSGNSVSGKGGSIYNDSHGIVTISNSTLSGNLADFSGGGIHNSFFGVVTISNSTLSTNWADSGGGIFNDSYGIVTINNVTLSANSADYGGGIFNNNTFSVTNSIFSNNSANFKGGGVYNAYYDLVTISNSTLVTNSAGLEGGGIYAYGNSTVQISHSTLSGNNANIGGGIYIVEDFSARVNDSIIANSLDGGDCSSGIDSRGHNLDSDGTCNLDQPTDLPNTDPLLGQLEDNGGATLTHALLPGSPAIDVGDNDNCPATDQRGVARPKGAGCDIGAYERETIVLRLDYQYGANDGSTGTGRYTLLADNTFVDEQNGSGMWQYQPTPSPRLALQYNPGFACNALSIGNFTGPAQVQGWRLCRDGSGVIGLWTGTVATGVTD